MLKFSLYSFILYSYFNYHSYINVLNSLPGKLFMFSVFFPYSLVEKKNLYFAYLTLSLWNSVKQLPTLFLKRCSVQLCTLTQFDGKVWWKNYIWNKLRSRPPTAPPPQHLLTAITLLGGGAGDRETRAKARCELRLRLLCSLADSALLQVKSRSQRARAKGLRVRSEPVVFPLKCILCFLPASALSLQKALVLGHRVSESVPGTCWGTHWCGPSPPIRIPGHFLSTESTSNGYLPNSDAVLGLSQG